MKFTLMAYGLLLLMQLASSKLVIRSFDLKEFLENKYKFLTKFTPSCVIPVKENFLFFFLKKMIQQKFSSKCV